jgi:hypothetical protein
MKEIKTYFLIFLFSALWFPISAQENVNEHLIQIAKTHAEIIFSKENPHDFKVVHNYGTSAVVSLIYTSPSIEGEWIKVKSLLSNGYLYLRKENEQWQVTGQTGALQTGIRMTGDYMRAHTLKELIEKKEYKMPEYRIKRMRSQYILATSLDSQLIAHFNKNKPHFEVIKITLKNLSPREKTRYGAEQFSKKGILKDFNKALIGYVDYVVLPDEISENTGCREQNCFTLTLAFSPPFYKVGYFYMEDPERVPQMNKREYLVVYPLGNGWYFFRLN